MVGQARDNRGAAGHAPRMQVIHAGDADIGGGRGLMPGFADRTSASPTASRRSSNRHLRLVDFNLEPKQVTQERGGGRQFGHFQIGPAAQELGHGI